MTLEPVDPASLRALRPVPSKVIRASAGAGKTYTLTGHYLELLRRGATPDEVLATTFTRKAAGEIFGRVLTRLAEDDAERAMLLSLCRQLHRVSISTIDSFFHRLGSSFRMELGLPAEPRLIDEGGPLARELRAEAIEAVLTDAAASDEAFTALLNLLRRLHHDSTSRSVTTAIDQIVTDHAEVYRQAPARELWTTLDVPKLLTDEQIDLLVEGLRELEAHIPKTKAGSLNKAWANAWQTLLDGVLALQWDALGQVGLVKKLIEGETTFSRVEIPGIWMPTLEAVRHQVDAVVLDRIARQTEATYDLMRLFATRYEELRQRRGVMLYSDMTHRLASGAFAGMAGDVGTAEVLQEIYFRLDAAVTHLLLDEFQDTSLDQWAVLSPFAEEIRDTGFIDRSLFVVGDTKQAIYGWRGGCVELFDTVEDLVPEGSRESLATSYRSSQTVLDAVNTVFGSLGSCPSLLENEDNAEAAQRWQAMFEPHVANKQTLKGFVSFEASDDTAMQDSVGEEGDDAALPVGHERYVARRIQQWVAAAPGKTFGILVQTNATVNRLLFELRKLGVKASGEGGNPIADVPAVAAVLSALQLSDHPGDGAAAFHVLNSPIGQVLGMHTIDDAAKVAGRVRQRLIADGYAGTLAAWVEALAPSCDAACLGKLTRLVDLARQYEADGEAVVLRPGRFVTFVESVRVEEPSAALVRVMTVHRSKGLEFDAVVLPELDKPLSGTFPVLIDRPDPTGGIEGVFRYAGAEARAASPMLERVYRTQLQRERAEDFCTLYVAMTRARQALYMVAKPAGTPRLPKVRFAGILRETLGDPDEGYVVGDSDWMGDAEPPGEAEPPALLRLAMPGGGKAKRSRPRVSPSTLHGAGKVRASDLLAIDRPGGLDYGTRIHEAFEAVGYTEDVAVDELPEAVRPMLDHAAVRAALTRRFGARETLWRERSFVVVDGDRLLSGTFDRVAIDTGDGEGGAVAAHLIDFKTDRVTANQSIEVLVERYRPQVEAYRRALSTLLGLPMDKITAELLFVGEGQSVAV